MSTSDIHLVFVFDNKKIFTSRFSKLNTSHDRNLSREKSFLKGRERDKREMGNLCSNEIRTEEEDMASRDIERQLKEDEEKFKKISRLLLLGKFDFFFSLRRTTPRTFLFLTNGHVVLFCFGVNYVSYVCFQRHE